ncbi:MAG: hypothetical protein J0L61_11415, partial [Planctomycetes bacterium]|nr:hypothetical protein [Planctomycetota bacterium]
AVLKHQRSPSLSFEVGGEGAQERLDTHAQNLENGVDTPLPAAICGGRAVVRIDLPRSPLLHQTLRPVKQTFQQRFGV